MRNKLSKMFIFLCCVLLMFGSRISSAANLNPEIDTTITRLTFGEQSLFSEEEFHFALPSSQSRISFYFQLLPEQSSDMITEIAIAEKNDQQELFQTARKILGEQREPGVFSYQSEVLADEQSLKITVYYSFEANKDYILRFQFNRTGLLNVSDDYIFIKYPITKKTYANTSAVYLFQVDLPSEILKEDYRLQSIAETWFADQTEQADLLEYRSEQFKFRENQYIYFALKRSVLPQFAVNRADLTLTEFFPDQTMMEDLPANPVRDFLTNRLFVFLLTGVGIILILLVYFLLELEGKIRVRDPQSDFSIFELDAAHSAFLLNRKRNTNLLLAGLLQLVQKNEVDLHNQVFRWLYPYREDFSGFNSAEIFLLQWLFEFGDGEKFEVSARQINKKIEDPQKAEDFLLNFNKYILLLADDLYKNRYLNRRYRNLGDRIYLGLAAFFTICFTVLMIFNPNLLNLILLFPVFISFYRKNKARYFTLNGRIKVKQMLGLSRELIDPESLFKHFGKWVSVRDLAPLFLPYAMSLSPLNTYLHQIEKDQKKVLGILDLMNDQNDFSAESALIIEKEWNKVKNDILNMYYLLMASLVSAEIMTQKFK